MNPTERLDHLLGVKLRSPRLARDLYQIGLSTEGRLVEEVALHVQREIETVSDALRAEQTV